MATIDEKIAAAEKKALEATRQIKQLKIQREMAEARKIAAMTKGARSEDTRRKILAGAMVLDMMEKDEESRHRLTARLDQYLTRPDDRALFSLPATAAADPAGGA